MRLISKHCQLWKHANDDHIKSINHMLVIIIDCHNIIVWIRENLNVWLIHGTNGVAHNMKNW